MKKMLSLFLLLHLFSCTDSKKETAISNDEIAIRSVLESQVVAWNEGDINEFMEGYWKSDSILFVGSEIISGWTNTLERYKRDYPDKASMGILRFEILRLDFISRDSYLVTGKYFLTRISDSPHGVFTLLFRKKEKWLIVYDHTS